MTETMLERAAKAVCQATSKRNGWNPDRAWAASQNEFIEDAAVVLQAIREPDDALVSVTEDLGSKSECWWLSDALQKAWPVMIDSTLSQSQEGGRP